MLYRACGGDPFVEPYCIQNCCLVTWFSLAPEPSHKLDTATYHNVLGFDLSVKHPAAAMLTGIKNLVKQGLIPGDNRGIV